MLAASILAAIATATIAAFMFFTRNQEVSGNFGDLHRNSLVLQELLMLDLERIGRVATFDVVDDPMVASGTWLIGPTDPSVRVRRWVMKLRNDDAGRSTEEVAYEWNVDSGVLKRSSGGNDTHVFQNVGDFVLSDLDNYRVVVSGSVNEFWLLGSGALGQSVPFEGTMMVRMR